MFVVVISVNIRPMTHRTGSENLLPRLGHQRDPLWPVRLGIMYLTNHAPGRIFGSLFLPSSSEYRQRQPSADRKEFSDEFFFARYISFDSLIDAEPCLALA